MLPKSFQGGGGFLLILQYGHRAGVTTGMSTSLGSLQSPSSTVMSTSPGILGFLMMSTSLGILAWGPSSLWDGGTQGPQRYQYSWGHRDANIVGVFRVPGDPRDLKILTAEFPED